MQWYLIFDFPYLNKIDINLTDKYNFFLLFHVHVEAFFLLLSLGGNSLKKS